MIPLRRLLLVLPTRASHSFWTKARDSIRLAARPLLLNPLREPEAASVAALLCDSFPPALDGIDAGEVAEALQGPRGWHTLADIIEQAFVEGYEDLPAGQPANTEPLAADLPSTAPVSTPVPPVAHVPNQAATTSSNATAAYALIEPMEQPSEAPISGRLADRIDQILFVTKLLGRLRRLGLTTAAHLEALAIARGYMFPNESQASQRVFLPEAWRERLSDQDLAAALLSPGLQYSERAVCRGALMVLTLSQAGQQIRLAAAAHQEHACPIFHHVALLGLRKDPHADHWQKLVAALQCEAGRIPALPAEAMPDREILKVFATAQSGGV